MYSIYKVILASLVCLILNINIANANTNQIAAVVNNNYAVFNYEVETKQKILALLGQKLTQSKILELIITNYLILDSVKSFGITLTQEDFEQYLNALLQQKNITQPQLIKQANQQNISANAIYKELREEFLIEKVKQVLIVNLAKPSNKEIEQELSRMIDLNNKLEFELKQITINKTTPNAKDVINNIYSQLTKGQNFNKLAKMYSQDLYATQGGNIGFVAEFALPSNVASKLQQIKENSFTSPIETSLSYKIYFLIQAKSALNFNPQDPEHIAQLRQYAVQKITYEKGQLLLENFIKDILSTAAVTYY